MFPPKKKKVKEGIGSESHKILEHFLGAGEILSGTREQN